LVHVDIGDSSAPLPGDLVTARVTYAAPHHLVADEVREIRYRVPRHPAAGAGVLLGMPGIGTPTG
jgi:tRNA-2-methylthio-N6-dimethylallyladenosine synthase